MGAYLSRAHLRPRPVPLTLGPGLPSTRPLYPARHGPPALRLPPERPSLIWSQNLPNQAAAPSSWQKNQRALVAPMRLHAPHPVKQAGHFFLGLLSFFWSGQQKREPADPMPRMSSWTPNLAAPTWRHSPHLALQRVWSYLTDHLPSSHGKKTRTKAPQDLSTQGDHGEEREEKDNLAGPSIQGGQGRGSQTSQSPSSNLSAIASNPGRKRNAIASNPGRKRNAIASNPGRKRNAIASNPGSNLSAIASNPGRKRNAIASSYSSTLELLPQIRLAGAAGRAAQGPSRAAGPGAPSITIPGSGPGAPPGAHPRAGPGAATGDALGAGPVACQSPAPRQKNLAKRKQRQHHCEASPDSPRPKKRKVILLLPCRRDRPLKMPPAPELGFPITVEFYDAEKRAAIQRLNEFLMGDGTKVQGNPMN